MKNILGNEIFFDSSPNFRKQLGEGSKSDGKRTAETQEVEDSNRGYREEEEVRLIELEDLEIDNGKNRYFEHR